MLQRVFYINISEKEGEFLEYIKPKLLNYGYKEASLNEIRFCPILIVHRDWEDNTTLIYENINEGFLKTLLLHCICEECKDIDTFIYNASLIRINQSNINAINTNGKIKNNDTVVLF